MKKKFIPIIGAISSGKSTFLKGFLGTNVLQTGSTTTTKFICLIKNSTQTSFYHVIIPENHKSIEFEKEGEEIKGDDKIKKKIKEINNYLKEKKGKNEKLSHNELFYMLETPIKNIENVPLLENCYFMDIPGLNEYKTTYIDDIFSLIPIDDILFEIIVFDAEHIDSDNIVNIIKEIGGKKKCLKKSGNIFILNKIDKATKDGDGDIVDKFRQFFYNTFENEKNKKKDDDILINIYENHFVALNSILYEAEIKMSEDFYSMLYFELYLYLENKSGNKLSTFFEYLCKRIEVMNHEIKDNEFEDLEEKDMEIIKKSVKRIKSELKNIETSPDFELGIDLDESSTKKELKKIFFIHKNKHYHFFHSNNYDKLQNIIKNININNNDLSSPPNPRENEINEKVNEDVINQEKMNFSNSDMEKSINIKISIIEELNKLENFFKKTFEIIDKENELKTFINSFQVLRDNIFGRKIRIPFIGNISVGKSSVLNCIIGHDILPSKNTECTYRGVILCYEDSDTYKLFTAKLEKIGEGGNEYFYFKKRKLYCQGIESIKSHLVNKNNDKEITDDDAYIIITGKLKIFEYIKLNEEMIKKIEFIDLPGTDKEKNPFNENNYQRKILQYSNCCIYINTPATIDDKDNVFKIKSQYSSDKDKINLKLRFNFIKTCLFLINKCDEIKVDDDDNDDDEDYDKQIKEIKGNITNNLYKYISEVEENLKKEKMNFSFFSAKFFSQLLSIKYYFVQSLEKNPIICLEKLFNDYRKLSFLNFISFNDFIIKKVKTIKVDYDLSFKKVNQIPDFFKESIKKGFDILYDKYQSYHINLKRREEDEIIENLFFLKEQLKSKDFSNTNYSSQFFNDLEKVIQNSEDLQNKNYINTLNKIINDSDNLFNKKAKDKKENSSVNQKKKKLQEINEKAKKIFNLTENRIKNSLGNGKYEVIKLIEDEIKYLEYRLKEKDNNIDNSAKKLQEQIKSKIKSVENDFKAEMNNLFTELKKLLEEELIQKEINDNVNLSNIDDGNPTITAVASSLITGGLVTGGIIVADTVGAATAGVLISGAAFGWGIAIGLGALSIQYIYNIYTKETKYKQNLEKYKEKMEKLFIEAETNYLIDFDQYKNIFFDEFNKQFEINQKEIKIESDKWESIKKEYKKQQKAVSKTINYLKENIKDI